MTIKHRVWRVEHKNSGYYSRFSLNNACSEEELRRHFHIPKSSKVTPLLDKRMKNGGRFETLKLVFRIRKRYFDAIVNGKKKTEFRKDSEFWRKRILGKEHLLDEAVFICGKRIHRRRIIDIIRMKTPFGFSEQGKSDVDTVNCFAISLGIEIVNENGMIGEHHIPIPTPGPGGT